MRQSKPVVGIIVLLALMSGAFLLLYSPARQPAPSTPSPPGQPTAPQVRLNQSEAWVRHLGDSGVVRLLAPDEKSETGAMKEVKQIEGLGRLNDEQYVFARSSVERLVQQRNDALIKHYNRPRDKFGSEEEQRLEEAQLLLHSRSGEACLQALNAGSYFVVKTQADKPPMPDGVTAFNVPIIYNKEPALLVVVVNKKQFGLDAVEENVGTWRSAWMSKVAYDFNAKSAEERQEMLKRFARNDPADAAWRKRFFPKGMRIDETSQIMFPPQ